VQRGEIYVAVLRPRSGSEQQGKRPVVIVSHDGFNSTPTWRSIIVVPLSTSKKQAARGPTAVLLSRGSGGLQRDGVALCHQVTTLDRAKLSKRLGKLHPSEMDRLEAGLKAAMNLS
jgi:mRNA-degrading endonuclease toxin of MazEF toxin-antitoxin module